MSNPRHIMGTMFFTGVMPGPSFRFRSRLLPAADAPVPHPSVGYEFQPGVGYCRLSSSLHSMINWRAGLEDDRKPRDPRPQDICKWDMSRQRRRGTPLPA